MKTSIWKRHSAIFAGFGIFGTLLAIFWPVLFGGRVLLGNWTIFDQYPRLIALGNALQSGDSTLWYSNYLGGSPIYLGVWGEYMNPISQTIFRAINPIDASHWIMLGNALLGALFIYWLARELSLSKLAATLAAFVYTFSEWNLTYGTMLFWSNVYPLTPLLFLSVLMLSRKRWRYLVTLTAATAYGWYMVMPDVFLYILIATGGFALYLDWSNQSDKTIFVSKHWKTTLLVFGALCLGTLLAAPKLVPDYVFVNLSTRSGGVQEAQGFLESAESHGYIGPNSLIDLVYPFFTVPFVRFIPFLNGADKLTVLYIGIPPLILLALFLLVSKKLFRERSPLVYFLGLFVFTVIILIKYIPLFWLIHHLPVFKLFGGTGKYAFLLFFSVPLLVGYTLDSLNELYTHPWYRKLTTILLWFLGGLVTFFLACNVIFTLFREQFISLGSNYFATHLYKQATTGKPFDHYVRLIETTYDTAFHSISLINLDVLASFFFVALGALLLVWHRRRIYSGEYIKKLFLFITIANIIVVYQGLLGTAPRAVLTRESTSTRFLKENLPQQNPYRVFHFWGGLGEYAKLGFDQSQSAQKYELETDTFLANYAMLHNIPFLGGYENLLSFRQARMLAFVGATRAPGHDAWISAPHTTLAEKITRFTGPKNRELLELLGVKYVVTSFPFPEPWKQVFSGKTAQESIPLFVYETARPTAHAYFAQKPIFITPEETSSFITVTATSTRESSATVIECTEAACANYHGPASPSDSVTIEEIRSGYLRVITKNKNPRWLVVSESYLPTWTISIADIEASSTPVMGTIRQANYLFQTVLIPAGSHSATFQYPGVMGQFYYSLQNFNVGN